MSILSPDSKDISKPLNTLAGPPLCEPSPNSEDDILIFADPYDHYDDYVDGYTFLNAERFYWMWFDARYFGKETWGATITVTPRNQEKY